MTESAVAIERTVTTAQPSDEEEIMEMCRALHEENGLLSMSEARVRATLQLAFQRRGGVLGVIRNERQIEAMIFMLISQMWCEDGWHLEELFNYCRPEYRKSSNAKTLMQFAKKCAIDLQLPLIIGVLSNTRTEEKVRLYQRQFSKPNGCFFVFNTRWNDAAPAAPS